MFAIDIERCGRCGGQLQVIASIEEPALIERILACVQRSAEDEPPFAARAAAHRPSSADITSIALDSDGTGAV